MPLTALLVTGFWGGFGGRLLCSHIRAEGMVLHLLGHGSLLVSSIHCCHLGGFCQLEFKKQ